MYSSIKDTLYITVDLVSRSQTLSQGKGGGGRGGRESGKVPGA